MKKSFLFAAACLLLVVLVSCRKSPASQGETKTKEYELNNCKVKTGNSSGEFEICFTKLITDCRCPNGAVCVWEGYAEGEFSIKKNNQTTVFKLATLDNGTWHSSFEIDGIKIKLENILPYPDVKYPWRKPVKAILKIEY